MDKEFDIKINIGIEEAKNLVKYLKFNTFQVPTNSELESLKDGEFIIKYCGISYYIKKYKCHRDSFMAKFGMPIQDMSTEDLEMITAQS